MNFYLCVQELLSSDLWGFWKYVLLLTPTYPNESLGLSWCLLYVFICFEDDSIGLKGVQHVQ